MSCRSRCNAWLLILTAGTTWLLLNLTDVAASRLGTEGAAIGIDIGAVHIRVSVVHNGEVTVLKNDQGSELTPCYVAFTSSGHRLIGDEAKSQLAANPRNTVFSVLPLLGRKFDDALVQEHIRKMPYSVFSNNNYPSIDVRAGDQMESFAPEEIVAMLLRKMREIAEKHMNRSVTRVVVSVPSCFSYVQRRAMRDAVKIAGLGDARIVNSHMATALAYYLSDNRNLRKRILVFDVGGSSVSASVISVANGIIRTEAHRQSCGQAGDRFEQRIAEQMMKLFVKLRGPKMAHKLRHDPGAVQRIRREVEKAVRYLSSVDLTIVEVESLIDGLDFYQVLTRSRFEELNMDLLRESVDMLELLLDDNIQEVVLVGGSSHIPMVQEHVKNLLAFHVREPSVNLDPSKAATVGAAYWAESPDVPFAAADVYPHSLGFVTTNRRKQLIAANEPVPVERVDQLSFPHGERKQSAALVVVEGEGRWEVNTTVVDVASIEFPPTSEPIVLVTFSVDSSLVLRVTMEETQSQVKKTVAFDHRLSHQEMKRMARRLQTLDDIDRFELRRIEARDELESMAYAMMRMINKADGMRTGELLKAERAALDVVEWLETNSKADAEEFLMKKRQLMLAVQKFKL